MIDEMADRLSRFRAEAASRDLPPDEVELWIRAALPAVFMAEGGDGPPVARVGGDPMLPEGVPEPRWPFAASVDLAALPPGGTDLPLPTDGHLLFFAAPEVGGLSGVVPDAVMYVPAGTPTVRRPLERSWREPYQPRQLQTLWHQPCPPMDDSFAMDTWGDDPDDEQYELADELGNAWTRVGGHRPPWVLQIGGHAASPQFDPVHYARDSVTEEGEDGGEGVDDWALLASWRCGEDVTELDSGVVHWVIRRRDLAARRFDRVHRYVDMA
ncbi:DUF1963 domain-containing protein [Allostreptomyces psammosilenae]|uniref:DUF1963 domain-containing protein n=1 Tax=Allostreptomyces psammosilenae TaxID=1892865 RepID=A0A853ABU1_9ACTN|nr:DUF1963 domain-containing protein [Allostreptomyces psammosilenae]NYI07842.1 hypothetical protein [Allostreptomyces psammosilenae]